MAASVEFTITFDGPDEEGWIVARVLEVPGAMSQGRTREEARENVLDALRTVLTPDEDLACEALEADREHLRFTAVARSTPSGVVPTGGFPRCPGIERSGRSSSARCAGS
jgi:predicted RNase H-like HicB family nuclease